MVQSTLASVCRRRSFLLGSRHQRLALSNGVVISGRRRLGQAREDAFIESVWKAKALYKAAKSRCDVRCTIVPASRRRPVSSDDFTNPSQTPSRLQDARKVIYFQLHSRQSYADELHRSSVAISVDQQGSTDRIELGNSDLSHPHALLDISQVDEMEEEFVATVRTKGAQGGGKVLGEPHALSSADLADHVVQLFDEVEKRFGPALRAHALSPPGTPSGSGFRQRAKAAAGLENFGRSLLFGSNGAASSISSAGISNLDVFGSPARRSDSNASKSTFSSTAASISSRGKTMSTAGTSISSRSAAFEGLSRGTTNSPGSFRRFGRRRSSSVGPSSTRCDADSGDENDLPRHARAMTPDSTVLLSTSAGAASSTLSRRNGNGTLVGGRGIPAHVRSRPKAPHRRHRAGPRLLRSRVPATPAGRLGRSLPDAELRQPEAHGSQRSDESQSGTRLGVCASSRCRRRCCLMALRRRSISSQGMPKAVLAIIRWVMIAWLHLYERGLCRLSEWTRTRVEMASRC